MYSHYRYVPISPANVTHLCNLLYLIRHFSVSNMTSLFTLPISMSPLPNNVTFLHTLCIAMSPFPSNNVIVSHTFLMDMCSVGPLMLGRGVGEAVKVMV